LFKSFLVNRYLGNFAQDERGKAKYCLILTSLELYQSNMAKLPISQFLAHALTDTQADIWKINMHSFYMFSL
jgi:hypothetical protein